ncbi:MAG: 3-deoxy-7-phosphoheptulonate synthase [Spirochaetia bacterium]|nr:3-deoxy-7-phosphoheptulonate synthase [Spirochaetia bacterium]
MALIRENTIVKNIQDLRIKAFEQLISPQELLERHPASEIVLKQVEKQRQIITNILQGTDSRLLAIVGPCSIHDKQAALEYAERLQELAGKISDRIFVVMRTYFEKPRTVLGWRGLILDPYLDGSYRIADGLEMARSILISITETGLPVGCEMLDPIVPQYIDDLVAWAAIGARTTESQTHRNLASGLSVPVGFKNSTSGNLTIAVDAIKSASNPASFIGIDKYGQSSVVRTTGNPTGHLILRGGTSGPNYYEEDVEKAARLMEKAGVSPSIIIDCSHANSNKKYRRQARVLRSVIDQKADGYQYIKGFMLESSLFEGNQTIGADISTLAYGVSITDACIGWEETERIMLKAYAGLDDKEEW